MKTITSWSDIPDFEDEAAEAEFWSTAQLGPRLMNASIHQPDSR